MWWRGVGGRVVSGCCESAGGDSVPLPVCSVCENRAPPHAPPPLLMPSSPPRHKQEQPLMLRVAGGDALPRPRSRESARRFSFLSTATGRQGWKCGEKTSAAHARLGTLAPSHTRHTHTHTHLPNESIGVLRVAGGGARRRRRERAARAASRGGQHLGGRGVGRKGGRGVAKCVVQRVPGPPTRRARCKDTRSSKKSQERCDEKTGLG